MRYFAVDSTISAVCEMSSHLGIPSTVMTDSDAQFTAESFSLFLSENNIEHLRTVPYLPQPGGLAERTFGTIEDSLRKVKQGGLDTSGKINNCMP